MEFAKWNWICWSKGKKEKNPPFPCNTHLELQQKSPPEKQPQWGAILSTITLETHFIHPNKHSISYNSPVVPLISNVLSFWILIIEFPLHHCTTPHYTCASAFPPSLLIILTCSLLPLTSKSQGSRSNMLSPPSPPPKLNCKDSRPTLGSLKWLAYFISFCK